MQRYPGRTFTGDLRRHLLLLSFFFLFTAFSQGPLISVERERTTIRQLFEEIEEQTGFCFAYSRTKLDDRRVISLSRTNGTLDELLGEALRNTGHVFEVRKRHILLLPAPAPRPAEVSGKPAPSSVTPRQPVRESFTPCTEADTLPVHHEARDTLLFLSAGISRILPVPTYLEPASDGKSRSCYGQAFPDFEMNHTRLLPKYKRNITELPGIRRSVGEVTANRDVQITGIVITGYASPDGLYSINGRLAHKRAVLVKEYIRRHFNLPDSLFTVHSVAEDWDGLRSLLMHHDVMMGDEALRIIDGAENKEGCEGKLMRLGRGKPFAGMKETLFPLLRRVEYRIDYRVREHAVEEARSLIYRDAARLGMWELYRVAHYCGKGSQEYWDIYTEIVPDLYRDDTVACINAAAALIEQGEWRTAVQWLEKVKEHPAAWNNLGVILLLEGQEVERAEELFSKAMNAGILEAQHNLKAVCAVRGGSMPNGRDPCRTNG